jgi:putative peptidoglycan lipid II flippase
LYYADRINQLPLGVIGVAVGTALLPLLSRQLRAHDDDAAMASLNRALEFALFLTIPAALALVVIPGPIISVLFERGAFDAAASAATADALVAFSVGLPAYVLIKVLAPGFFAREDTVTPVKIAALCVVINIGLSLILMGPMLHVGVALATSISAWVNAILLGWALASRGHLKLDARLRSRTPRILAASLGMVAMLYGGFHGLDWMLGGSAGAQVAALMILVVGGLVAYGALSLVMGAAVPAELRGMMRRRGA